METESRSLMGKIAYGAVFVVLLPGLLWLWARGSAAGVDLPAIHHPAIGMITVFFGLGLMFFGMASLWGRGGGLPMNAYPPPRYVSTGIYGLFRHPIYIGFSAVSVGVSLSLGSASGLWLISPTVMLASAALVLGYELPDLYMRFGNVLLTQRFLPPDDDARPSILERARCYLTVLAPWLILYEATLAMGIPKDARSAYSGTEMKWPVWSWTEIIYASVYLVVLIVPLAVRHRSSLRQFSLRALLGMLFTFPLYWTIPLISPPRESASQGLLAELLRFDRAHDGAAAAFPSYHVIWAFVAAEALGRRNRWLRRAWRVWAVLVSVSCVTTGLHALVDVLGGWLIAIAVIHAERIWEFLRSGSETIANSWKEWRIGPLRIINHGAYAAAGVAAGVLVLDSAIAAPSHVIPVAIILGGAVGAALWAQTIEGSPSLLRPLGFYGGMLGSSAGGLVAAALTGANGWVVLAALCVAGPWIQGIGRLRCLVQGCCHGHPTSAWIGIHYTHPRSRVCRLTEFRDMPLHPTPLYSLLWNVLIALVVTRLYMLNARATLVGGVYLILCGLGRFVEEAYRGEPQTPVYAGLRLYQWIALSTVVIGAFITTLVNAPSTPNPVFRVTSVWIALGCGVIAWLTASVDFPESNRRFARLA